MQSINDLLSPAGPNPSHDFKFRSFEGNKQDPQPGLKGEARDSQGFDSRETTDRSDKDSSTGSEVCFGLELEGQSVGRVMVWSDYKVLEMAEYDVDPMPLKQVLDDQDQGPKKQKRTDRGTRSQGIIVEQKVHWQKRDVVAKGLYKPWFFSRFARGWVPLGKPQCLSDLKHIATAAKTLKPEKPEGDKEQKPKQKKGQESDSSEDEEEELWVQCEGCDKWRRVPEGVNIDVDKSFFCKFLPGVTCKTPEEEWDDDEEEEEQVVPPKKSERDLGAHDQSTRGDAQSSTSPAHRSERSISPSVVSTSGSASGKKRKSPNRPVAIAAPSSDTSMSSTRNGKLRRTSPASASNEDPMSPEDITAGSSLYDSGSNVSPPAPSRLAAVVQVLTTTGKALHYDTLTRQALKLGLIRFTGSQGTAGESMKAFLNKTIRENKSTAIVNMGKGIYGLRDWDSQSNDSKHPSGPSPTMSQMQNESEMDLEDEDEPCPSNQGSATAEGQSEGVGERSSKSNISKTEDSSKEKENVGIAALLN